MTKHWAQGHISMQLMVIQRVSFICCGVFV